MKRYWNWLANAGGTWNKKIKKLLDYYETPYEIYRKTGNGLEKDKIVDEKVVKILEEWKKRFDVDFEYKKLEEKEIKVISIDSNEYPEKLKNIYENPCVLYVRGELPREEKCISVVGARECSEYGRNMARKIGEYLGKTGVGCVSGMARGIDTYAHLGALGSKGKTYAVLGCGIDVCYPIENIELYEEIIQNGGIISEYPMGVKPDAWRFPQRNRIISGLSDGVIVVEARRKSGSLITAEHAIEQGIDVMVVPGRVYDVLSEGCNVLIKEGAEILTDISDISLYFGIKNIKNKEKINNLLEKDFDVVYSLTDLTPISLEELVKKTGFKIEKVFEIILELQMKNLVYEPVKNYYARKI